MDTKWRPGKGIRSSTMKAANVVGFRMQEPMWRLLQERAAAAGEKANAFARRLLVEALTDRRHQQILGALGELRGMMLEEREAKRRWRARRFEERRVPPLGFTARPRPVVGTIADLRLPTAPASE
jgi:hypothetical protein